MSASRAPKRWLNRALTILGLVATLVAAAEQTAYAGTLTAPNNSGTFASQSIARDAPPGFVVKTPSFYNTFYAQDITCPINSVSTVSGTLAPGYTDLFKTSIDGIGVRFRYLGFAGGVYAPATQVHAATGSGTTAIAMYRDAEIWIYGPVATGTTPNAALPSMTLTYSGDCFPTVTSVFTITGDLNVTSLSCSVTTPAVNVTLPKISAGSLPAVGSTAGATPVFIGLNCGGIGTAKVYVTLTDQAAPSNTTNLLTLTPTSTVKGVQLQLLNAGTPVSFGPDSAAAGTKDQILVAPSGGLNRVVLTAQYVRTGPITPGNIDGVATFTMSYQ